MMALNASSTHLIDRLPKPRGNIFVAETGNNAVREILATPPVLVAVDAIGHAVASLNVISPASAQPGSARRCSTACKPMRRR